MYKKVIRIIFATLLLVTYTTTANAQVTNCGHLDLPPIGFHMVTWDQKSDDLTAFIIRGLYN